MKNIEKLTILHSNDLHGDFLSEHIDDTLVGGVSHLAGYINSVRSSEKNVVYAIAGDMFRGSVIDSEYQGVSTIEIMNALAPDIVSIGNHEVDYGIAHLLFVERCAKFPIINANMYIKTNGSRLFNPYKILHIGKLKVLFIGIVTEQILDSAKKEGLIGTIIDTEDAAKEVGKICNAVRSIDIDLTVLLTHIGIEEDKRLAALLDPSWGVDLIIGGHSHTLMDKPEVVNGIPIVHAYMGTDGIGRADIDIDIDNNCIDSLNWNYLPIDSNSAVKDEKLEEIIYHYKDETDKKYERIVAKFKHPLTHPARNMETELGNLFADILKDSFGVDIMLVGSGSIRVNSLGPTVTLKDLYEAYPYHGKVYRVKWTGKQLKHALKFVCRDEAFLGDHTEFYQISHGLLTTYNKTLREFTKFEFESKEVEDDKLYSVGLCEYHYASMENFFDLPYNDVIKNVDPKVISTNEMDSILEYFSANNIVDSAIYGRLAVVD